MRKCNIRLISKQSQKYTILCLLRQALRLIGGIDYPNVNILLYELSFSKPIVPKKSFHLHKFLLDYSSSIWSCRLTIGANLFLLRMLSLILFACAASVPGNMIPGHGGSAMREEITYVIDPTTKELTIQGTGIATQEGVDSAVTKSGVLRKDISKATVGKGITQLGESIFNKCWALADISLPSTLEIIGKCAFDQCSSLKTIPLPRSVEEIGDDAFRKCDGLTEFEVPNTIKKYMLGRGVFRNCKNLGTVTFEDGQQLDGIFSEWFQNSGLHTIKIPNTFLSIAANAFENCTKLESIDIPDSIYSFLSFAFSGCANLANINFSPDSRLQRLERCCFQNIAITRFELPSRVGMLGWQIFLDCKKLEYIKIPAAVSSMYWHVFGGCTNLKTIVYCGDRQFKGEEIFGPAVIAAIKEFYVLTTYPFDSFGNYHGKFIKILDNGCNIPSPTASLVPTKSPTPKVPTQSKKPVVPTKSVKPVVPTSKPTPKAETRTHAPKPVTSKPVPKHSQTNTNTPESIKETLKASDQKLSKAAIGGIAGGIGALVIILVAAAIIVYLKRRPLHEMIDPNTLMTEDEANETV